jgi:hypothetical protein
MKLLDVQELLGVAQTTPGFEPWPGCPYRSLGQNQKCLSRRMIFESG